METPVDSTLREALCPCCKRPSRFADAGVQHWPKRVTDRLHIASEVHLWHCQQCKSTVSEHELMFLPKR